MRTSEVTSFVSDDDWVLDDAPSAPPPPGATPTLSLVEPLEEELTLPPSSFFTDNLFNTDTQKKILYNWKIEQRNKFGSLQRGSKGHCKVSV